jgi:hypothetical protein
MSSSQNIKNYQKNQGDIYATVGLIEGDRSDIENVRPPE